MRILVYPPSLRLGGSQLGAVELAEEMSRRGHEVVVFAEDGPLRDRVSDAGLPLELAPDRPLIRPWPATTRRLVQLVRAHDIDIVHAYEWPPILEATYGTLMTQGVPVVGTVMSMGVAPFIPPFLPLVVGTAQIGRIEQQRRPVVEVVEPPVDLGANRPGVAGPDSRRELGIEGNPLVVVLVSRLANELKREGILEAVRAVGLLAAHRDIRLLVAGDGPARLEIQALVDRVNQDSGREVVTLLGAVMDPRAVYDVADIALGMGSSALRAMAFGKPVVVQGERGFWRLLDEDSLDMFLDQGWYGIGDGRDGTPDLVAVLDDLADAAVRRADLGAYAQHIVSTRFSLERAGALHEEIYRAARRQCSTRREVVTRGALPFARAYAHELHGRVDRLRRRGQAEDFNAISAHARLEPLRKGVL